jgi:hypothetical protein
MQGARRVVTDRRYGSPPVLGPIPLRVLPIRPWSDANPDVTGATVWQRIDAPWSMARRRVDYIFLVLGLAFPGDVAAKPPQATLNTPDSA